MGLHEMEMPGGQIGTDITKDLNSCRVFFAAIELK